MKPLAKKEIIKKIKNSKTFCEYNFWKETLSDLINSEREGRKRIDDIIRANREAERKEKIKRFEEELKKERVKEYIKQLKIKWMI